MTDKTITPSDATVQALAEYMLGKCESITRACGCEPAYRDRARTLSACMADIRRILTDDSTNQSN